MWNIGHAYCTLFGKLQCDRTDSLQSYFDLIQNVSGVPLIALLGCGCSPATEPVAEISHYEDIIHVRLWFMYKCISRLDVFLIVCFCIALFHPRVFLNCRCPMCPHHPS